jgi:Fe-S-cluster containining protein
MANTHYLPAGRFSSWLDQVGVDVPCGTCTACCTSSQFVHIAPDEGDTLARIPKALLFPAPGLPKGNVVMGYDERGHCPMLADGGCSIYEHRPRTCRTYDCRVFAAAGIDPDDGDGTKAAIAEQVGHWRFRLANPLDEDRWAAVRAATAYLRSHPEVLPDPASPPTNTRLAVAAVEAHEAFLAGDPGPEAVRVELRRRNPGKVRDRAKGPRRMGR